MTFFNDIKLLDFQIYNDINQYQLWILNNNYDIIYDIKITNFLI